MLVEIAIGDAYGAGFEFASDDFVREHNDLSRYYPHPKDGGNLPAGSYTDDTQMSVAIVEHLKAGEVFSKETFAEYFVRAFRRDPRQGYAERFFELLRTCENGADLLAKITPNSSRNGAMMRSVPLGLLPDAATVLRVAEIQASVTHDTFFGKLSSQIIGLMAHSLLNGSSVFELEKIVWRDLKYHISPWPHSRVACDAEQTVRAVWTSLFATVSATSSMSALLKHAVSYGGDTDSVASVALGLASLTNEFTNDLPEHLVNDLESGWPEGLGGPKFGRYFLLGVERV